MHFLQFTKADNDVVITQGVIVSAFLLFQWEFSLFPIITLMLTRTDFLKNKDPVKRLDIILQNSLDYKEQTISVFIVRVLGVLKIVQSQEKALWKKVRKKQL